ncbi:YIP1 family protein [Methanomicrobium mobile]|uniref:YIP1 family protein n=1 Tax=Methanomicrobium mobile TaxID=2205 RepID=UPI0012F6A18F|nr:YIP1 family protein [Methanomicrobium mobile]
MAPNERLLAEIPNIDIKGKNFRLFLTNLRLVLMEGTGRGKAPAIIPLSIIRNIASSLNFADDPVLTLTLGSPDGGQKKMVLVFTQEFSGVRDKERDQLKKVLEGVVSESRMTVKSAGMFGQSPMGGMGMGGMGGAGAGYGGQQQFGFGGAGGLGGGMGSGIGGMGGAGFGAQGYPQNQGYGQPFGQSPMGGMGMGAGQGIGGAGAGAMGGAPSAVAGVPGAILSAANVVVKSQEYTVSITGDKIVLLNPNQPAKPSTIPLGAVRSAEGEISEEGEPAVALMVESQNGNMRRMVLRFSLWYNKNRWGERETWVHAIQDYIATGRITELYTPTPEECLPSGGFSAVPPSSGGMGMGAGLGGAGGLGGSTGSGIGGGFGRAPTGDDQQCPVCGNAVAAGAKFCGNCGHTMPAGSGGDSGLSGSSRYDSDEDVEILGGGSRDDDFFPSAKPQKKAKKAKQSGFMRSSASSYDGDYPVRRQRRSGPIFSESSLPGRLISFIRTPWDAFQNTRGQDVLDALPVFGVVLAIFVLINSILYSIIASDLSAAEYPVLSTFSDFFSSFIFSLESAILIVIFTAIYGVLIHLAIGIIGYTSDINDGLRISVYSQTALLITVIPFIGLFLYPLWAFLLQFMGIRETYRLENGTSLLATIIPAVIILVLFVLFLTFGEDNFSIFGE